jgi:hypothetical protein
VNAPLFKSAAVGNDGGPVLTRRKWAIMRRLRP